ncbi:type 1 glutamine amidotransferase [Salinisphaera sp. SPP-AMP-43]|uniref:gamma-glutamyl-gamma-aminobutyrate hydrolase family protein n=1 Tax=Salinisphaera sp. SPP-AMP-43 TaxID=3121288 RepID=UPI003C6DCD6F
MTRPRIRPRIAVTGRAGRWAPGWWCTWLAVHLAGGRAVRATPTRPWPESIVALIIGGGDDIATDLYTASASGDPGADHDRDAFEIAAIQRALAAGQPILGICRGAQLLNVVAGGSLFTDITARRRATSARINPLPCQSVAIRPSSGLAEQLGAGRRLRVNSLHHQAIDRLGRDLCVAARDADGFVQAVECRRLRLIGVQWHPEYLIYRRASRRLFRALVIAAHRA